MARSRGEALARELASARHDYDKLVRLTVCLVLCYVCVCDKLCPFPLLSQRDEASASAHQTSTQLVLAKEEITRLQAELEAGKNSGRVAARDQDAVDRLAAQARQV